MQNRRMFIFIAVLAFFCGVVATLSIQNVSAHGGDTNLIHSCVKSSGSIRIVGPNDTCANNETALDWNKQGTVGSFVCVGCNTRTLLYRLNRQNFLGVNLNSAILTLSQMDGNQDFTSASFAGAVLTSVKAQNANFSNTNFNHAAIGGDFNASDFTNSNLESADLSNGSFSNTNFTNARLNNAIGEGAILEAANLTNANLLGATGFSHFTFGDYATWSNTICPDGTNSDNNGNTCIGHLTP